MLSVAQAREKVIEVVRARCVLPASQNTDLAEAEGRVLAEAVVADRDYPPFDRSTRDGFAVRSRDAVPGATLNVMGEIKAGSNFAGTLGSGQCARIMTGAPVPQGADAVVMFEHARYAGDRAALDRGAEPGQNVVPRGREARAGEVLLRPGARLGYAELALAGQVGRTRLSVYPKPRVAILSTGDEVVAVGQTPGAFQIRNSNSVALAAQASTAGAEPVLLGNAPDQQEALRRGMEKGFQTDILVLSGGVSAGKYDLVEGVLRELGAEFFFDSVAMRPGRPAVFAACGRKFAFGLPGNPVSTMVTFELFVLPAIDVLGGAEPRPLAAFRARLAEPVRQKPGLTHFLPAEVSWPGGQPTVRELPWQGSGDICAMARAKAFLVVPQEQPELAAGDWVDVLPRRGCF